MLFLQFKLPLSLGNVIIYSPLKKKKKLNEKFTHTKYRDKHSSVSIGRKVPQFDILKINVVFGNTTFNNTNLFRKRFWHPVES